MKVQELFETNAASEIKVGELYVVKKNFNASAPDAGYLDILHTKGDILRVMAIDGDRVKFYSDADEDDENDSNHVMYATGLDKFKTKVEEL